MQTGSMFAAVWQGKKVRRIVLPSLTRRSIRRLRTIQKRAVIVTVSHVRSYPASIKKAEHVRQRRSKSAVTKLLRITKQHAIRFVRDNVLHMMVKEVLRQIYRGTFLYGRDRTQKERIKRVSDIMERFV